MEYRLHHRLSKSNRSVFLILKPISHLLGVHMACFFLSRNYWSSSDYDLITSIWENTISILAGNLNSGRSISYYSCKFMFSPLNCSTLSSVVRKFSLPKWTEQLLLLSLMCRFRWMARLKKRTCSNLMHTYTNVYQ